MEYFVTLAEYQPMAGVTGKVNSKLKSQKE